MISRLRRGARDERGAIAILVAVLSLVIFGMAALAVDVSMVTMERQRLHDTVDSAAHTGAYNLPGDGAGAKTAALNLAKADDATLAGTAAPSADLYCVVASLPGTPPTVNTAQIPTTCDPGSAAVTGPGVRCNASICAIPCAASPATTCNTVKVTGSKDVPFRFAPVIGRNQGSTGSVASAACKGSCGAEVPNPMDVVFMADRTPSMSSTDRNSMKLAITETLKTMTPSLHYVAFGALHKSRTDQTCKTEENTSSATGGTWIPLAFTNTYLTSAATPTLDTNNALVKGIQCLPASDSGNYGTHLASSLKGAALYLTGNNTSSLPARVGVPKKVLIFETDGMPDEVLSNGYQPLTNTTDFGAGANGSCRGSYPSRGGWCSDYRVNGNGLQGCKNLLAMANEAKAAGITVITVGFGQAATGGCDVTNRSSVSGTQSQSGGEPVRNYLAAAASAHPTTGADSNAGDCATPAGKVAENNDGDFFFCATSGSELGPIFKTAITQVSSGIRLINLP